MVEGDKAHALWYTYLVTESGIAMLYSFFSYSVHRSIEKPGKYLNHPEDAYGETNTCLFKKMSMGTHNKAYSSVIGPLGRCSILNNVF